MTFSNWFFGGGAEDTYSGDAGDEISNSLRFRGGQHLTRTPVAEGNRQTWTYSVWVKNGVIPNATTQTLFSASTGSASNSSGLFWETRGTQYNADLNINFHNTVNGTISPHKMPSAVCRDFSAWYHLVLVADISNSTAADRVRVYINGVRQDDFLVSDDGSTSILTWINSTGEHAIGSQLGGSFYNGYMADVHFIDGQALEPTAFGRINDEEVWVPRDINFNGSWGTNGFHLDFSDANDIGADSSGNNNDFTASGFELVSSSSVDYDHMEDTPTDNYATFNPLVVALQDQGSGDALAGSPTTNANLGIQSAGEAYGTSTFAKNSGRWYCEVVANFSDGYVGLHSVPHDSNSLPYDQSPSIYVYSNSGSGSVKGPTVGETVDSTGFAQYSPGDIIGIAVDIDSDELYFSVNGVWQNSANPLTGTNPITAPLSGNYWTFGAAARGGGSASINFGQKAFAYTPPTFSDGAATRKLTTKQSDITTILNGRDHFRAITATGPNILSSAQSTFPSGLWWIKDRQNDDTQHQLVDSVRGGNLAITCPTLSTQSPYTVPSGDSVAWCWNYNSSNPALNGFEIIRYSGTGTTQTINHNLGKAPEWIITQAITGSPGNIPSWHIGLGNDQHYLRLERSGLPITSSTEVWNNIGASSYDVGSDPIVNASGTDNMIAYLWTSVPGYSSFGTYQGNSNGSQGIFVHTGMRVKFIIIKSISGTTASWILCDAERKQTNPVDVRLTANSANAEATGLPIDFLSNGFKIYNKNNTLNGLGITYAYAAFAENPFSQTRVPPTAR